MRYSDGRRVRTREEGVTEGGKRKRKEKHRHSLIEKPVPGGRCSVVSVTTCVGTVCV